MNLLNTRNITKCIALQVMQKMMVFGIIPWNRKITIFRRTSTADAYFDYYLMAMENPFNFTKPRRTRIGLVINF